MPVLGHYCQSLLVTEQESKKVGNCFDFHNIFFADVPSVFKTMSGQDGVVVQRLGLLLHRLSFWV